MNAGRNKTILLCLAIFMITAATGIYLRTYPAGHNIRERGLILGRLFLYSSLRNAIATEVDRAYPGLSSEKKHALINERFRSTREAEDEQISASAADILEKYKGLHRFYLLGADSYYYFHLTKKLLNTGGLSDTYRNGKFLDRLMLAPLGHWRNIELHPYTGFFIYKVLKLFDHDISPMNAAAAVPLLLYLLCLSAFMFVCLASGVSRIPLLVSSFFFSLAPMFMQRSSLGWYDTDPYNVLFPLLILLIMYRMFSGRGGHLWGIALAAISAFYALFWQGWILLPVLVVLALLAVALYRLAKKESPLPILGTLLLYLAATSLIASVLITPAGMVSAIKEVFAIFFRFALIDVNPWPDLYLTVGELKRTSMLRITHLLGGFVFAAFSVLGFIVLALGKDTRTTREQQITVCVITAGCLLLAGSAERFALFPLAPASLCLAVGLNTASAYLRKILSSRPFAPLAVNTLLCLTAVSAVMYGHFTAERQNPIYNKVWDSIFTNIGSRTPPESIVTTWWPPGHFIRAMASRGVSFDGATLEMPQAYWVACFFLSDNEKEALGILRMRHRSHPVHPRIPASQNWSRYR